MDEVELGDHLEHQGCSHQSLHGLLHIDWLQSQDRVHQKFLPDVGQRREKRTDCGLMRSWPENVEPVMQMYSTSIRGRSLKSCQRGHLGDGWRRCSLSRLGERIGNQPAAGEIQELSNEEEVG